MILDFMLAWSLQNDTGLNVSMDPRFRVREASMTGLSEVTSLLVRTAPDLFTADM